MSSISSEDRHSYAVHSPYPYHYLPTNLGQKGVRVPGDYSEILRDTEGKHNMVYLVASSSCLLSQAHRQQVEPSHDKR